MTYYEVRFMVYDPALKAHRQVVVKFNQVENAVAFYSRIQVALTNSNLAKELAEEHGAWGGFVSGDNGIHHVVEKEVIWTK